MTSIRSSRFSRSFSRRRFLQGSAGMLAAGAAATHLPRRARAADEINALVWCDHTDPALLDPFTEATGIRVNTKEFATTGEALAILEQSRPGDWDALVIDTVDVQRVARLGHLAALTPDDYPWGDIFPELRDEVLHYVDGKLYGVPEKFGYNTVAYDANKVDATDMRKASVFWNPKYAGRIAIYDYYVPVMQMVAIGLGIVPPQITQDDLPAIREKLLEMKKLAALVGDVVAVQNALVTGSADIIAGGGEFAVAGLQGESPNLDWVLPDEGGIRWMQSLAIFETSARKEAANQFVQYVLSPDGQGRLATSACYWAMPANSKATLDAAQKKTLRWDEQPTFLPKSYHYMSPEPDIDAAMLEVWTEFLNA